MLYNFARGKDTRSLNFEEVRKSVALEINWGVRFTEVDQVYTIFGK